MFISKTASFSKIFFFLSFSGLVTYVLLGLFSIRASHLSKDRSKIKKNHNYQELLFSRPKVPEPFATNLETKYILMYSANPEYNRYEDVLEGQFYFRRQMCQHRNCFLSARSTLIYRDIRNFDAVVMHVKELYEMKLPVLRRFKQKYIFHGMGAPTNEIACNKELDGTFNWTWSYRLNSDIVSPFFEVRDRMGEVVAPRLNARWWFNETTTASLEGDDLLIYKQKTKAVVVIFSNNCRIRERKAYAEKLRSSLEYYSLTLDIYGCDGYRKCPNDTKSGCDKMIASDYYFILVQEEIFADDYLTESVLMAYLNNAVPLIRSGADLNNFLPTGSYIDVRRKSVDKVAALIHYIINNPAIYYSYFRWKKFYTFHKSLEYKGVCELCAFLNNKTLMETHSSYAKIRNWWYNTTDDATFCANVKEISSMSLKEKGPPLPKDPFFS